MALYQPEASPPSKPETGTPFNHPDDGSQTERESRERLKKVGKKLHAELGNDNGDEFLTEKQLASRWALSAKKLQTDRGSGKGVQFVRVGRLVRYRLSDVLAYEESHVRRSTSDTGGEQ